MISNEILKTAKLVISEPILRLFNSILSSSIYPSQWKMDILSPIHKSGEKMALIILEGLLYHLALENFLIKFCKNGSKTCANQKTILVMCKGVAKQGQELPIIF